MKNKHFKNLVTFIICFIFMLNITDFSISAQTPNVQLYSTIIGTGQHYDHGRAVYTYYTTGYIYVNNLNSNKKVSVHYTYDGINWLDQPATYLKTLKNGSEVWSYRTPDHPYAAMSRDCTYNCRFAIKYEVNGNTYWDNNNGQDYFIQYSNNRYNAPYILSKSVVTLHYPLGTYSGRNYLYLKDLGPDKSVKVRYTADNWLTYKEINASHFISYDNNVEEWYFDLDKKYEFAIGYTVNGITYWDNNFESNYKK
ncbi:glycogen-binding regulatory subunit of S/T protein phosphatase I [Vallitalea longa]|uniref:Glycogen-binding regulatory subunit of S/T protein phosphatase I n=1 Tax=Vallitalea longa TaxID=2936439 RepID=A0A9W5YDY9_9FIRM|nr:carbohydrate-binding protein [Vallitalea longa]GKX30921.1 glycogen-binding regulatory subunit of S/T protein phosphatase I [Vallitalea longa]